MNDIALFMIKLLFSLMGCVLAPYRLYLLFNCKEEVIAKLDKIVGHSKGGDTFIFTYTMNGTEYQGNAQVSLIDLTFSKFRKYRQGEQYTIYANVKHPAIVNVRPHITFLQVLGTAFFMLIGIIVWRAI